jgi:hypothetical protein
MEPLIVFIMVQHIDCKHLIIREGDGPETYFCLKSRKFIDLDILDEEISCPGYISIIEGID